MTLTLFIVALFGFGVIAYRQMSARIAVVWSVLMILVALFLGSSIWIILAVFMVGSLSLLFSLPDLRQRFVTSHVYQFMQAAVPNISQTEREALEAGTVWWEGDLFSGKPDWQALYAFKKPQLSEEEQAFLDGPVQTFCAMLDDWQSTQHLYDLSAEAWDYLKKEKFLGMIIPKEYGGLGFSALAHSSVVTKIATRSISAAVTVMVPNSLGPGELLLHYGTQAQKDHYLPKLAIGEEIPCFALTGPEAGSDAAAIPDAGYVCEQTDAKGNKLLGIRLSWNKRYITLAPVATVLGIAFKLFDPEHLLGEKDALGITCALIPTDTPGVEIGDRHFPLNGVFMNGPTRGEDIFIPMSWVIGEQAYVGKGWRMLMESLATGRCISLPALSVGGAQLAARSVGAYARVRRQFNTPIGQFEGVQEALARIGGYAYQMNAARVMTLGALDTGQRPSVVSAILKYHLTERLRITMNDAMDIQGGAGICLGPKNIIGRAYQTIPVAITVEGANILTRSLIIFGQGAMRAHPTLFKELEALRAEDQNAFDTFFIEHIGSVLGNVARSFWRGISVAGLNGEHGKMAKHQHELSHLSAGFALIADITLVILGGGLKRKERISARLGDALSQLYLASATLKQFHNDGEPAADLPLVNWSLARAKFEAQNALLAVLENYPSKAAAMLLKVIVFPLGRRYKAPNDVLDHTVADILLKPSQTRDRLTENVFISDEHGQTGKLERALLLTEETQAIERKIKQALGRKAMLLAQTEQLAADSLEQGVINEKEAKLLVEAAQARNEVIQVDAFASLARTA